MRQGGVVPQPVADLARNLWAAAHLLVFRRSALRWLVPTPRNFLILLLLSLTISFLFDFLGEGWPGVLSPVGVAVYLLPSLVLLVFGQILATRHGLWRLGLAPASVWLAADVLLGVGQCLLQYAASHNMLAPQVFAAIPTFYSLLYAWPVLAVVFVFTRALVWPWWERSLAFVLLFAIFTIWSLTFSNERLWYADQNNMLAAQPSRLAEEDAFYAQQELLPRALSAVQAERPDRVDWYFLGVAGAAYQNVFRSELETVRTLFDNRFATSGRSLVLINNDDTVMREPIATRTSIARALQTFSQRMNKEQDVLFLFLTSHGSEDHLVELNYAPLELSQISPEWLRQTLDASGIRRRVIVISACYSGGFIPVLQTPDTLIITAADADKTSFGCQDDAELTYFGRAFFDEALRREYDLRASYDRAVQAIAEREQAEGFELSRPQWFIGERLEQDLPMLQQSLFPPAPGGQRASSHGLRP